MDKRTLTQIEWCIFSFFVDLVAKLLYDLKYWSVCPAICKKQYWKNATFSAPIQDRQLEIGKKSRCYGLLTPYLLSVYFIEILWYFCAFLLMDVVILVAIIKLFADMTIYDGDITLRIITYTVQAFTSLLLLAYKFCIIYSCYTL